MNELIFKDKKISKNNSLQFKKKWLNNLVIFKKCDNYRYKCDIFLRKSLLVGVILNVFIGSFYFNVSGNPETINMALSALFAIRWFVHPCNSVNFLAI